MQRVKNKTLNIFKANLPSDVELQLIEDRALLALQGPKAAAVLSQLNPAVADMVFMDAVKIELAGVECYVSRSGYTGEDGYEISVPAAQAADLASQLLATDEVEWIGLGARDSLRLECGLCLYGHDLDPTTTPVEASLLWGISKNRRSDGERAGGFPGSDLILEQIKTKNVNRKRIGLIGQSKAPVREGTKLFDAQDNEIGIVTSGTYGPSIAKPVAMGYVKIAFAALETEVFAEVRGKKLAMIVSKMPFVAQSYFRG